MLRSLLAAVILLMATSSYAETIHLETINYLYDLGHATAFDFEAGSTHQCGSKMYRVVSTDLEVLKRKYSMLLTAVVSGKKVIVDAGDCYGNRRLVDWTRIYN